MQRWLTWSRQFINHRTCQYPPPPRSPLREVIFAIRAILPLIVALSALILLVLRRPLPAVVWEVAPSGVRGSQEEGADGTASEADTADASVHSRSALNRASVAVAACMADKGGGDTTDDDTNHGATVAAAAVAPPPAGTDLEGGGDQQAAGGDQHAAVRPGLPSRLWSSYGSFFIAVAVCQIGMIIFNIGGLVQVPDTNCLPACRPVCLPGWLAAWLAY